MQALTLFSTILFAWLPSTNSTKWFPGSRFCSKLINFDSSVITCSVAPQSINKLHLPETISYPKAKK